MGTPLRPTSVDPRSIRHQDAALKEVAARITRLSFRDMRKLSDAIASRPDTESVAESLLAVADEIIGPDGVDELGFLSRN